MPDLPVKMLVDRLKLDPRFGEQPVWYYVSAQKQVAYTFRSWLSSQRRKQWRLEGKRRWLEILRPDAELAEIAKCSTEALRSAASRILKEVDDPAPFNFLLKEYGTVNSRKRQCALAYLLKRNAKLDPEVEDLEKLEARRGKTEIQIKRLEMQLQANLPKGRDLTGQIQSEALAQCVQTAFIDDAVYSAWQSTITRKPASLPFPIIYETVESLVWSKDCYGRYSVCFQGQGTSTHTFKIYCDKPHQHWFERFWIDQETKRSGGDQHSAGLFTLRSARLSWVPSKDHQDEPEPWNRYYLNLSCTVDTDLWTQEGTQLVLQKKAASTASKLQAMREKESLNENQQGYVRRLESTMKRLQTPYPRPSRDLYQGRSDILVGVSMGLDKPATVAVINVLNGDVLAYRSTKQLLGEKYPLLQRARSERAKIAHQGHRQRRKGEKNVAQESNLGEYVDRLLAKAIVEVAQQYWAGGIVLPDLSHIREIIEAEVKQKAAAKVPDFVDGQKQYAKAYRAQVHQWSYNRLQNFITSKAEQSGLSVETTKQEYSGSPQEKAKLLCFAGYENRLVLLS